MGVIFPQTIDAETDFVRVDGFHYYIRRGAFSFDGNYEMPLEYFEKYDFGNWDGSAILYPNRYGQSLTPYSFEGEVVVPESFTVDDKTYLVQELLSSFNGCTRITNVVLPWSVFTVINAFYGCKSLESIILPPFIPILFGDFTNCTSLK